MLLGCWFVVVCCGAFVSGLRLLVWVIMVTLLDGWLVIDCWVVFTFCLLTLLFRCLRLGLVFVLCCFMVGSGWFGFVCYLD